MAADGDVIALAIEPNMFSPSTDCSGSFNARLDALVCSSAQQSLRSKNERVTECNKNGAHRFVNWQLISFTTIPASGTYFGGNCQQQCSLERNPSPRHLNARLTHDRDVDQNMHVLLATLICA